MINFCCKIDSCLLLCFLKKIWELCIKQVRKVTITCICNSCRNEYLSIQQLQTCLRRGLYCGAGVFGLTGRRSLSLSLSALYCRALIIMIMIQRQMQRVVTELVLFLQTKKINLGLGISSCAYNIIISIRDSINGGVQLFLFYNLISFKWIIIFQFKKISFSLALNLKTEYHYCNNYS